MRIKREGVMEGKKECFQIKAIERFCVSERKNRIKLEKKVIARLEDRTSERTS